MKKVNYPLIGIVVAAIFLFAIFSFIFITKENVDVCFYEKCVHAEVAYSEDERAQGLMFREKLGDDNGMLFWFDRPDNYKFWMKNTLIPLDIIWIDENFKVVHIANAIPCVQENCPIYNPNANARYVLEVNGGFADENGISVGDEVSIR